MSELGLEAGPVQFAKLFATALKGDLTSRWGQGGIHVVLSYAQIGGDDAAFFLNDMSRTKGVADKAWGVGDIGEKAWAMMLRHMLGDRDQSTTDQDEAWAVGTVINSMVDAYLTSPEEGSGDGRDGEGQGRGLAVDNDDNVLDQDGDDTQTQLMGSDRFFPETQIVPETQLEESIESFDFRAGSRSMSRNMVKSPSASNSNRGKKRGAVSLSTTAACKR